MITGMDLFKCLGGFWFDVKEVKTLCDAIMLLQEQTDTRIKELEDSVSRHTIQVFRTVHWLPVQAEDFDVHPMHFDGKQTFDRAGVFDETTEKRVIQLPDYVKAWQTVQDSVLDPSFAIAYQNSPYVEVPKGTETVYLKEAKIDCEDLYYQFGYALGLKLPSSEQYKRLINAIMDALVNGPSKHTLLEGLSAMCGTEIGESAITWSVPCLLLDKRFTGLCEPVLIRNQEEPVRISTENGFTRIDLDSLPTWFMDIVHHNGIVRTTQVTDPCELKKVEDMLR